MKKIGLAVCSAILSLTINAAAQNVYNDATLARVRSQDLAVRSADGKLPLLSAAEHAFRADVYSTNRVFPQAREHWQKLLENYPLDQNIPKALFGTARSYMWEREYEKAVKTFDLLIKDYLFTKEGREGLAFKGASYVRLEKPLEAAKAYEMYVTMFPNGERIDTSYLNIIDAYREAKRFDDAVLWAGKARLAFRGKPTEANAAFAVMRLHLARKDWQKAVVTADETLLMNFRGAQTSREEVLYLKAYALEKLGRKSESFAVLSSISDGLTSYYGGLATAKLGENSNNVQQTAQIAANRTLNVKRSAAAAIANYPAPFRADLLRYAAPRGLDPRFLLAVMKQESSFRPNAKSPAAARGLLQLTFDTAQKYAAQAGFPNLQAEDLYKPDVNIAVGSAYIDALLDEFDGLAEAVAASYNGGEDNAARWLKRSATKEPFIFASEVGFAESKDYVFKVMSNYRVYRELYTEDLKRK